MNPSTSKPSTRQSSKNSPSTKSSASPEHSSVPTPGMTTVKETSPSASTPANAPVTQKAADMSDRTPATNSAASVGNTQTADKKQQKPSKCSVKRPKIFRPTHFFKKFREYSKAYSLDLPPLTTNLSSKERYEAAIQVLKAVEEHEKNQPPPRFPTADSPEIAASMSRLEASVMTAKELEIFSECIENEKMKAVFLKIRNRILQLWHLDPSIELTLAAVKESIGKETELEAHRDFAEKIFQFLDRSCLINFGIYKRLSPDRPPLKKKVLVIGAGISGLIAARKLKEFGFQVVVFEGTKRIGGRIHTWKSSESPAIAELGAMIITGTVGNPLYTILKRQLGVELVRLSGRCPLFTEQGQHIPQERDEILEVEFNHLLSKAAALAKNPNRNPSATLGETLELLMKQEDVGVVKQAAENAENTEKLVKVLTELFKEQAVRQKTLQEAIEAYEKLKANPPVTGHWANNDFKERVGRANVMSAAEALEEVVEEAEEIEKQLNVLARDRPPARYLDPEDRSIICWHEANLEFANANHLNCLSLSDWDQDDEFELSGGHYCVPTGLCQLVEALSEGLEVQRGYDVAAIKKDPKKETIDLRVAVAAIRNFVWHEADLVLSTIPLGVLQDAMDAQETGRSPNYGLSLIPDVPTEKVEIIQNMGFGLLNKVYLTFKTRFWQVERCLFGITHEDLKRRGEFFLFWSLYDQHPTLIALISGEAGAVIEEFYGKAEEKVMKTCMSYLRRIFGDDIEDPVEFGVTKWGLDRFFFGAYSSVAPNAKGEFYDKLAEPMHEGKDGKPLLFFAGEHTNRQYPATMHGALLSGLREATRIADLYDPLVFSSGRASKDVEMA